MSLQTVAVIPARNEADLLPETLAALWTLSGLSRLIVVDDGSTDATPQLARKLDAEVIPASLPDKPRGKGSGKGRALHAGLSRARSLKPDAVLTADADLGPTAASLKHLLRALAKDHPAVFAAFPPATGGGFGLIKNLSRRAIARRTGYTPAEPLSGQRALLTPALDALPGIAPGFGAEAGMTLDLLAAGIKPLEVPLPLEHRPTGRTLSGFTHRARQGLDILRALRGARIPW